MFDVCVGEYFVECRWMLVLGSSLKLNVEFKSYL